MPPRGTLPLKVRIPGCEPIRRLSGTHDIGIRKKLIRMLHTLHEQGRDDLVNAVARGTVKPLALYNRWKFSRLDEIPHADELPRYTDLWPKMLADVHFSDDHHASLSGYYTRLGKLMPEDATLASLPKALQEYRVTHRTQGRSFEYAQNAAARLVRWALGRRHHLYLEIRDIERLKKNPKQKRISLTPDQLRDLVKKMGQPWGQMAWTMATTGMGWREYNGPWEREGEGLRIHGTKTGGRDRLIPLVSLLHAPQGTRVQLAKRLAAAREGVTPRVLRRTFTQLMVEAGIPRPRRKLYLGHTSDDITSLYEFQEVQEYLTKDAEKMRSVLGEPESGPTLQVVRA